MNMNMNTNQSEVKNMLTIELLVAACNKMRDNCYALELELDRLLFPFIATIGTEGRWFATIIQSNAFYELNSHGILFGTGFPFLKCAIECSSASSEAIHY